MGFILVHYSVSDHVLNEDMLFFRLVLLPPQRLWVAEQGSGAEECVHGVQVSSLYRCVLGAGVCLD